MLRKAFKTIFPRFSADDDLKLDRPPDLAECSSDEDDEGGSSDCSSSEKAVMLLKTKYACKEDEDVAMFLSLISKMSVQSLLFILQNHARAMHNVPKRELSEVLLRHDKGLVNGGGIAAGDKRSGSPVKKAVFKKFRFAEVLGGKDIRKSILGIPHLNEMTQEEKDELWWSKTDQQRFRYNARKCVRFFSKQTKYAVCIEGLTMTADEEGDVDDILQDHYIRQLTSQFSYPRGLECHIVKSLGEYRSAAIQAVLEEQTNIDLGIPALPTATKASTTTAAASSLLPTLTPEDRIREVYKQAGSPLCALALKMAEVDHVEALKASISAWIPEPPEKDKVNTTAAPSSS